MAKYQFFKRKIESQEEIRYLRTDQERFIANREQLLTQGFEVVGYLIHAPDDATAIENFNYEMTCPLLDSDDTAPLSSRTINYWNAFVNFILNRTKH